MLRTRRRRGRVPGLRAGLLAGLVATAMALTLAGPATAAGRPAHGRPAAPRPAAPQKQWPGNTPNPHGGKDYFVDSAAGSDTAAGTSRRAPWKTLGRVDRTTFAPGDRILLKAGSTWHGEQLWPKGSGTAGHPITIAAYGKATARRPYIAADGVTASPLTETGAKNPATVGTTGAVVLRNQQYYEISDLEISNDDDFATDITGGSVVRDGVSISINADLLGAADNTVMHHFEISDLDVHDVDGTNSWQKINAAGVNFSVYGSKQYTDYRPGGYYFQDVRIEDNTFRKVELMAVQFAFNWFGDAQGQTDAAGKFHEGWEQLWVRTRDLYSRDVHIAHNYAEDIGQGAFNLGDAKNMTVEYNEVNGFLKRYEGVSCALYTWASSDVVMQYNEVYGGPAEQFDGTPWDLEYTNFNVTYQYNYSHDNQAGWMAYMGNSSNSIARYNLSVNDNGTLLKNMLSTNYSPTYLMNNVFVYDGSKLGAFHDEVLLDTVYVLNNVFDNTSKSTPTTWSLKPGALARAVFANNDYYEASGTASPGQPADLKPYAVDPRFVADPTEPIPQTGVEKIKTTAARFALRPSSPLVDAGRWNPHAGTGDFFGHHLYYGSSIDVGLAELPVGRRVANPVDTDPIENVGKDTRTDLALNAPVTASSTHPGANLSAANLTDGSLTTRWAAADEVSYPVTLDVDFAKPTTFDEVDLDEYTDSSTAPRVANYRLQVWTGSAWQTVATRDDGIGVGRVVKGFAPVSGTKLRVSLDGVLPGAASPTLSEVRVYRGTNAPPAGTPTVSPASATFDLNPARAEDPGNVVTYRVDPDGSTLSALRYIGPEGNVLSSLATSDYTATTTAGGEVTTTLAPGFLARLATGDSGIEFQFADGSSVRAKLVVTRSS